MVSLSGPMKACTVLIALSFLTACASFPPPSADTVYVNGKIITVDKAFTIAQAVAVKDGRFVGVGTSDEMRRYVSPTTRVVDLNGRAVIPGLMDSHTHMLGAGAAETRAPLFRARRSRRPRQSSPTSSSRRTFQPTSGFRRVAGIRRRNCLNVVT